jgi:UPF0176 protein
LICGGEFRVMGPVMPDTLNISAYKFAPLTGLEEWRSKLLDVCRENSLKGTILLSPEGINLFVAGERSGVETLLSTIRGMPGLGDFQPKESLSMQPPFGRMLVKIKKEIITFGVKGIDPAARPTAKLPPRTLKQWLDEGRAVTLLDTRNNYEVRLGTFRGAIPADIDHFRDFPDAVKRLPAKLKEQPLVMFCTGGIRCEKAGPFMEQAGFKNVLQLDGGILKYFEECNGTHYDGECFVFDERVGVDAALRPTGAVLCMRCQQPVSLAEQKHAGYQPGKSCPACAKQNP